MKQIEKKNPTKLINLSEIERSEARQPRDGINKNYVAELVEALTESIALPPIVVYSTDGNAPYFLADGWHRFAAHSEMGMKQIECEILIGGANHAFKFSLGANTEHGLRRTNADKRHAATLALNDSETKEWSDTRISQLCKVSHVFITTVRREIAQLESVSNSNAESKPNSKKTSEKRTGKDGKSYPANKPKKEKTQPEEEAEAVKGLPPKTKLQFSKKAALALASAPEEEQEEIAESLGEEVTEKTVKAAVEKQAKKKAEPEVEDVESVEIIKDALGQVVPEKIEPAWKHAVEIAKPLMKAASELFATLTKIFKLEKPDPIYAELNNGDKAKAKQLYLTLKLILPYALCWVCLPKSHSPKECKNCKGRGFVSQYYFESCAPKDVKERVK